MTGRQADPNVRIYFSDFFDVSPAKLADFGAFNISLVRDLPLFIDPFLLFNSDKNEYTELHEGIVEYLRFLRDRSLRESIQPGLLGAWFQFGEVKQNWLGFSKDGNAGSGLGASFAHALHDNLGTIFSNFGNESITLGSHLEKVCLVSEGIGRDNISDFSTNLIKHYLLEYTQKFTLAHIDRSRTQRFSVRKAKFSYRTHTWQTLSYVLPVYMDDFVLLTPKDILTADETWISRRDIRQNFDSVVAAIPNEQLRDQLDNYLRRRLADLGGMSTKERDKAKEGFIDDAIKSYPAVIEYYIRDREDNGEEATAISTQRVFGVSHLFVENVRDIVSKQLVQTGFYQLPIDTKKEARNRLLFFKQWVESNDGYRLFYLNGEAVQREKDLQLLFKLTWFASPSDMNSEVNNGRGPVDFKVSRGSSDKTLIEFKLAKNPHIERNLAKQLEIYGQANDTKNSLWAICYFTEQELSKVTTILARLSMTKNPDIVLIDCRSDNKPSASHA